MSREAIRGIYDLASSPNTKENVKLKAQKTILDRNDEFAEQLGLDLSGQIGDDSEDSALTVEDIKDSDLSEDETSRLVELLSKAKSNS